MKFMPQHFVVLTQYEDYDRDRGAYVGRDITNSSWAIADSKYHLAGLIGVFEREDAVRNNSKARCEMDSPESIQQLWFVRALSKRGAASKAIQGQGELLEVRSLSRQEVAQNKAKDREESVRKSRADLVRYRTLLEETHKKYPHLSREHIPEPDPDHPQREQVYLDRYAIGLYRCGALTSREMDLFRKTLETGYSDHRQSKNFVEIINQHDEGRCA
ncbi:hypothetical protein IVA88_01310 [Bradyrhizobium sp. 149]|uniref:hypothetical protein n=1 Tax=Bradyrhizobium sp. 149 TaxID=2782624 RepID=UPI001FF7B85B|nr:hypothetical protein [Bradyrhizobium sp. 149]MCK1650075.1 hypothetical protein [Bradyrhizobium sp. 149]